MDKRGSPTLVVLSADRPDATTPVSNDNLERRFLEQSVEDRSFDNASRWAHRPLDMSPETGDRRLSWGRSLAMLATWTGLLLLLGGWASAYMAVDAVYADTPPPDYACKSCHVNDAKIVTLPSGESLAVGVDMDLLAQSMHGAEGSTTGGLYCTDCHARVDYQYPHDKAQGAEAIQSRHDLAAVTAESCRTCHITIQPHNPGHLLAEKNGEMPTCVNCHGGHEVMDAELMAVDITATCQGCHDHYADPIVERVHQELVANFGEGQSCRTCHSDQPHYPQDAECRICHSLLTSQISLASGETMDLFVDQAVLAGSVHGTRQIDEYQYHELLCTDCHSDSQRYAFPHQVLNASDLRGVTLEVGDVCQRCHQDIYARQQDSIHAHALEEGQLAAATCADCHGGHAVQPPNKPRGKISLTCRNCHSEITAQYAQSVHGAALLGHNNPDVPVCIDCHGVHDINDPTTALFRVWSPLLCAECHEDDEMMGKYDISTDVFDTYVADFHGTTITLFEKQSPEHETNKAVCYDCHGVHDIKPVSSESSHVIKENLLATCQQCHPDATADFSDSWTSHFQPSLEHNPLIYLVNLFYQILIPAVLGFFALFIGSDLFRRFVLRRPAGKEVMS